MLTELHGKGGCLCQPAKEGKIRCPLIVRPNSEDVVTGHLFQALRCVNPRWWLPDLLNAALGTTRFRRQVYRRLRIDLWQNQPRYPKNLVPWDEGSTQVDVVITWENPPTTVFLEMKYLSDLSNNVSGDDGTSGYPSDQLIRNIRVGLLRSGYFARDGELFLQPPRDFVVLVGAPTKGHPLVKSYRKPMQLQKAIPRSDRLTAMPKPPFVGELSYGEIGRLLGRQSKWFTPPERRMVDDLRQYLDYKLVAAGRLARQAPLPVTREAKVLTADR